MYIFGASLMKDIFITLVINKNLLSTPTVEDLDCMVKSTSLSLCIPEHHKHSISSNFVTPNL